MTRLLNEYVAGCRLSSNKLHLKLRLCFNSLIFCLMIVIGFILLRIDFPETKHPSVRLYLHNRWLLSTSWFNLISLVYTPICIYCDWRELRGTSNTKHVTILNDFRFVCFSSILFPSTCFSDILFWKLWLWMDRDLVAPAAVDPLVPLLLQHCLHTVPLLVIMLDLFLVPRRRPKNLTFGVIILTVFLAAYAVTCGRSVIIHEEIIPLLGLFSGYNYIPLVVFVSAEHFLYFTLQWLIIDLVFDHKTPTHALISLLIPRCQVNTAETKNNPVPKVGTSSKRKKCKQTYKPALFRNHALSEHNLGLITNLKP